MPLVNHGTYPVNTELAWKKLNNFLITILHLRGNKVSKIIIFREFILLPVRLQLLIISVKKVPEI